MPPVIGFIFDAEGLSARDKEDIQRQSGGLVAFVPRRMFENYLLLPDAICAIMNSIEGFRNIPVQRDEILTWLAQHQWDGK